jgi:hypothetical protein
VASGPGGGCAGLPHSLHELARTWCAGFSRLLACIKTQVRYVIFSTLRGGAFVLLKQKCKSYALRGCCHAHLFAAFFFFFLINFLAALRRCLEYYLFCFLVYILIVKNFLVLNKFFNHLYAALRRHA